MSQSRPQHQLSPIEQELLTAALVSNQPSTQKRAPANHTALVTSEMDNTVSTMQNGDQSGSDDSFQPSGQSAGQYLDNDDSPYLGFDADADGDDLLEFDSIAQLIDDFPDDTSPFDSNERHEKRKSVEGMHDDDEGGGKRREGEGNTAKKPGRKALTAEPTTKRKAQNRAAQRAFRERKEKHLKDLETKVEGLEKATESTNQENGLLRAQVERLQIELKEYRKRLSWISNSGPGGNPGLGSSAPGAAARNSANSNQNEFQFEFPPFGGAAANQIGNPNSSNKALAQPTRSSTLPSKSSSFGVPGVVTRNVMPNSSMTIPGPSYRSVGNSPRNTSTASPPLPGTQSFAGSSSFDSYSALFSPSLLEASRQALVGYYPQNTVNTSNQTQRKDSDANGAGQNTPHFSTSSVANTDSPTSSYGSLQNCSSIGTSPEPSLSSPGQKGADQGLNTINEENQLSIGFGSSDVTSGLYPNSLDWFVQQNGGGFDPVLFGEYRESQDAVASQDFGAFFNDAFPLPELGSSEHVFNEATLVPSSAKTEFMAQVEAAQDGEEQGVRAEAPEKMMTCNKIWDRLQSMEKFRNGEIDIDNLCNDLKSKAQCSEGGAVVNQNDVDSILGSI